MTPLSTLGLAISSKIEHFTFTFMLGSLCIPTYFAEGSTGLLTYFNQSDLAGKLIVLVLVVCSLVAWTVMIGKYLDLQALSRLNRAFESQVLRSGSILDVKIDKSLLTQGTYGTLAYTALEAYKRSCQEGAISLKSMDFVESALQRALARQILRYESKMVLLASMVSGAPFLGLLGTVWGVMDAFGGLGQGAAATIQNLAPGVSGALLTTVAGLLVAIPSVFGYNFLLNQVKVLITELESFASWFCDRLERELASQTLV